MLSSLRTLTDSVFPELRITEFWSQPISAKAFSCQRKVKAVVPIDQLAALANENSTTFRVLRWMLALPSSSGSLITGLSWRGIN
ncbi:hypothetical protein A9K58_15715 [Stenotrophomonas maltophilia]|uniref:Uncharacterized protein n=1 Tax=Stenotrophomonas maltophilia TaxID=40324 RepID=A0A1A6XQU1_STEMA|nr:hypothetical protein [Stenotrophomonas maltophilia]OBU65075.1 hypothetical protein A9K58_15715 [Stenotrophomonas maltophilia]